MNEQGNKKLSKRDGAKDILDYQKEGYLPEAMVNFLATLGWNDGTEQEIFTIQELIQKFDLSRVQKSGAHFDDRRLNWLNGTHIRNLTLDEVFKKVVSFWPESAEKYDDAYRKKVLGLVQERLKYFAELPELTNFFFEDLPVNPMLISTHKQLKKISDNELKQMLEQAKNSLAQSDFSVEDLTGRLNTLLEETKQKPAVLFSLLRIATTQSPSSPGLAETMEVLGKIVSTNRINKTIEMLEI
jgi:glutamyl-tRNA synthetase